MDTIHLLIVDDEPGMRMAVQRALRSFTVSLPDVEGEVGFVVHEAATGEEGIEKIEELNPEILLLDYKLPGISGLEVLEKISEQKRDILTIMITAYASIETAVTATKRGAFDFLPKPFTPDELKGIIRKVAGRLILLEQARKLAEEKRKVRFQFISVLAHELKAPLAAIDGYLQIMRNHTAGEQIADYNQVIERSSVRLEGMRKMISDLLDLTRIESGEKQREFADVNLVEIARNALETVAPESGTRNITVTLKTDTPVLFHADKGEIEIIFNNLITNSVKYNRDNGTVDISIEEKDDLITITVTDTGIGMTEEEAGKLFKDFVRIKNEKTRMITGSGLGLSTVKKLALLYGGDVSVSSTPDSGSTFTVTLSRDTSEWTY